MLYGVLAAGLGVAAYQGYRFVKTDARFAVSNIRIEGASPDVRRQIESFCEPYLGKNIFSIDLESLRRQTGDLAWVDQVAVAAQMPDSLTVTVREHRPMGLARIGDRIFVLDSSGGVAGPLDGSRGPLDFPLIVGLSNEQAVRARQIEIGLDASARIKDASVFFWDNMETIDVSESRNLVVRLRDERAPIYLGATVIPENIRNYLTIAERIQRDYPPLAYIELGFPHQVAIKPLEDEAPAARPDEGRRDAP